VLLLKMGGAMHITVLEPSAPKRELALQMGADLAVDPIKEGAALPDMIRALHSGRGADVVFECVGNPQVLRSSVEVVKSGGQVMIIGVGPFPMDIIPAQIVPREIELKTSFVYDEDEVRAILGLMENKETQHQGHGHGHHQAQRSCGERIRAAREVSRASEDLVGAIDRTRQLPLAESSESIHLSCVVARCCAAS
jgi:threonine dehydrogenase-like Zn-dependent dehydrogenase